MGNLISHVEHLSNTIGPRPATTDAEERAAHYVRDVFESRGVETEMQTFDSPRTYGWAHAIYHALSIVAAVLSLWSPLVGLLLGAAVAIVLWMDLDTRWGLTALMPKGPSQNVIARHVPHAGRNERVPKVIVVAHYDSARASLAFSPGLVRNFTVLFALMKVSTFAIPVLAAVRLLPFVHAFEPWLWYVTLVPAIYLLMPLFISVHRELFMKYTPGANDNASGVAAMLGVLERLVPEPDAAALVARETAHVHTEEETMEADVMPPDALLSYSPVEAPPRTPETWSDEEDEFSWDTAVISGQTSLGLDRTPPSTASTPPEAKVPPRDPDEEESLRLFGTVPLAPARGETRPAAGVVPDLDLGLDEDTASFDVTGQQPVPAEKEPAREESPRRGLFGKKRKPSDGERRGVRDWLGVSSDFDARHKGKEIGSWDNFGDDGDDDSGFGWKGGAAGVEDFLQPGFAASEAARIRRRVTTNVDRDLVEKEIWFVATGAEEVGTVGMKAFLTEHAADVRDAVIINIDNIGAGAVCYVTREGMARRYEADRRLTGAARRAARGSDLPVKGRESRGLATDATPALARGLRAMSLMAFDINGRQPNRHWMTDTAESVSPTNLDIVVDMVVATVREL